MEVNIEISNDDVEADVTIENVVVERKEGIRDYNLLDSALETPFQSFGGDELYPTIQAKAARLGYGLIKNHCMIDGNKRIGTHAMLVFLALNGIELKYTQKELYETILDVAAGNIEYEGLLQWVLDHQN